MIIGHSNTLLLHLKLVHFFKCYVNDKILLTPLKRTLVCDSSSLLGCYVAVCMGPAYCCYAPSTSPRPEMGDTLATIVIVIVIMVMRSTSVLATGNIAIFAATISAWSMENQVKKALIIEFIGPIAFRPCIKLIFNVRTAIIVSFNSIICVTRLQLSWKQRQQAYYRD